MYRTVKYDWNMTLWKATNQTPYTSYETRTENYTVRNDSVAEIASRLWKYKSRDQSFLVALMRK